MALDGAAVPNSSSRGVFRGNGTGRSRTACRKQPPGPCFSPLVHPSLGEWVRQQLPDRDSEAEKEERYLWANARSSAFCDHVLCKGLNKAKWAQQLPLGKGHLGLPGGRDALCRPALGHERLAITVEVGLAIVFWQLGVCCEHCAVLQPLQ